MPNHAPTWKIGHLRSGSRILETHLVSMPEDLVGNRLAVFAQSGFGKTNAVKVMLWGAMDQPYGKLVFDRRGEYVPDTSDERGDVFGLGHHPHAREKLVLLTNRESHLKNKDDLEKSVYQVMRFTVKIDQIPSVDLIALYPNLTDPQREFLYIYEGNEKQAYQAVLTKMGNQWDETNWALSLADWFGNKQSAKPEHSPALVVRSMRKKLAALSNRPFVSDTGDGITQIFGHLRAGRTVVVDFSGYTSERDRTFAATLIARKLFHYNLDRLDAPDGPEGKIKAVIFFEEAQTLLSGERLNESSIFVDLAKEGRALQLGLVAITQQPSAISTNILSQFNTFLALHLEFMDDIQFLKKVAGNFEGLETDLRRKVPGHAYLVTRLKPFAIPLKVFHFDQKFVDLHVHSAVASGVDDPELDVSETVQKVGEM